MATHGTILLQSDEEEGEILLQTPSDGHTKDAILQIISLPAMIAELKSWKAEVAVENVERHHGSKSELFLLEDILDFERSHATYEMCLLELASIIVASIPCRYRVIPSEMLGYLADYDRQMKHHLRVDILTSDSGMTEEGDLLIYGNPLKDFLKYEDGLYAKPVLEFIEKQNAQIAKDVKDFGINWKPEEFNIDVNWTDGGQRTGIYVPFGTLLMYFLWVEARKMLPHV